MDELSAEEMRSALYEKLHNKGLLDLLKTQLRNHMISALSGDSHRVPIDSNRTRHKASKIQKKVVDSLIYRYLCENRCDYTVGVFLPEVNLSKSEVLSNVELLQFLGMTESPSSMSLLLSAVGKLMRKDRDDLKEETTQTDFDNHRLSDRLSSVDEQFSKRQESQYTPNVEERLLSYQRKVEMDTSKKYREDFERWKKLEIETIRLTEREKADKELQQRKLQLDDEYQRKISAVNERERSLTDSMKTEYECVQRETFNQRQQLLNQTEQLRLRETEMREERESTARLQRIHEEKVNEMERMLRKRETDIHNRELTMENTLRAQRERCKLDEKMAYDTKHRELRAMEHQINDRVANLDREKRNMLVDNEKTELTELRQKTSDMSRQVITYTSQVANLEMNLNSLHQKLSQMFDYDILKESNISLKKDLEMTKERLNELMKLNKTNQEKYEHLVIASKEKSGVEEMMMIKAQMQKERDKALDDKVLLEHRLKEAEIKFHGQVTKNQAVMREYELQTDRQRYMNKEYADLRQQMGDTGVSSKRRSPHKRPPSQSFYDTSFGHTMLPPEIALEGDWSAGDLSSAAEISTATEESIVTETRRRLQHLTDEAENLHSAFRSLTKSASPVKVNRTSPRTTCSPTKVTIGEVRYASVADTPDLYSSLGEPADLMPSASPTAASTVGTSAYSPLQANTRPLYSSSHTAMLGDTSAYTPQSHPDTQAKVSAHTPAKSTDTPTAEFDSGGNQLLSQADQFSKATPDRPSSHLTAVTEQSPSQPTIGSQTKQSVIRESMGADNSTAAERSPVTIVTQTNLQSEPISQGAVSLDSQWKQPAPSLDTQWKQPAPSLDTQWKKPTPDPVVENRVEATPNPSASTVEIPTDTKQEHDLAGIDPVMQRYMMMIKQQKDGKSSDQAVASQPKAKSSLADKPEDDEVISESIEERLSLADKSSNGGGDDDDFW